MRSWNFGAVGRLLLVVLLHSGSAAGAASIADQHFDDRVNLAGSDLVLNGVGLRAVLWLKGYAAGLYLSEKVTTPGQAIALGGPKRLQLKMMLDVDAHEFVKAIDSGMRRNHSETDRAALRERERQFSRNVERIVKLRKGDVVNLDFVPARGLTLTVNGAVQGPPVQGADFFAGILRIFIGERPVDKELKTGLLGAGP